MKLIGILVHGAIERRRGCALGGNGSIWYVVIITAHDIAMSVCRSIVVQILHSPGSGWRGQFGRMAKSGTDGRAMTYGIQQRGGRQWHAYVVSGIRAFIYSRRSRGYAVMRRCIGNVRKRIAQTSKCRARARPRVLAKAEIATARRMRVRVRMHAFHASFFRVVTGRIRTGTCLSRIDPIHRLRMRVGYFVNTTHASANRLACEVCSGMRCVGLGGARVADGADIGPVRIRKREAQAITCGEGMRPAHYNNNSAYAHVTCPPPHRWAHILSCSFRHVLHIYIYM